MKVSMGNSRILPLLRVYVQPALRIALSSPKIRLGRSITCPMQEHICKLRLLKL